MLQQVYYHAEQTECMTYFRITGKFDPDEVTRLLRIAPERTHKIGDKRRGGTEYDFAEWRFGTCTDYRVQVAHQMMRTIGPLIPKADLLRRIKLTYDANLTLQVVPVVRYDEPTPMLAPSLAVMRFCLETGTEMDIDLYVGCPDDLIAEPEIE